MHSSIAPAFAGFAVGLSLIIAIGAQNAFVLRQGIARNHVLAVVVVCATSDFILITAGVAGAGVIVDKAPAVFTVAYWGGAAFLLTYSLMSARRAFRPSTMTADHIEAKSKVGVAIVTALALTWLNPHVYLDTVVLLGSIAATFDSARAWFGVGAAAASIVWFGALGYGARLLRPVFSNPFAWRMLDSTIAVFMLVLGIGLAIQAASR